MFFPRVRGIERVEGFSRFRLIVFCWGLRGRVVGGGEMMGVIWVGKPDLRGFFDWRGVVDHGRGSRGVRRGRWANSRVNRRFMLGAVWVRGAGSGAWAGGMGFLFEVGSWGARVRLWLSVGPGADGQWVQRTCGWG